MAVIHFDVRALAQYRHTYHPALEIRMRQDMLRMQRSSASLSQNKIAYIPRNILLRIIEDLTIQDGAAHPRLLGQPNFKSQLPGWTTQLQGIYKYFCALQKENQAEGTAIDFMMDYLGVEQLDSLPIEQEIKLHISGFERIPWERVSKKAKRHLIEQLTQAAKAGHPRLLASQDFSLIIPEFGITLTGLISQYSKRHVGEENIINLLLDDLSIPPLGSLSILEQLEALKLCNKIHWEKVPIATQRFLISRLKTLSPMRNGISCPHERAIISDDYKNIKIPELNTSLSGLHDYYRRKTPDDYKGTAADYMLDQLSFEALAALPYETQCRCLRYVDKFPWLSVPKETVIRFLKFVQETNGLPHLRFLKLQDLKTTIIPDIGQTLEGFINRFEIDKTPDDLRDIVDIILDYYGIEKFDRMPFELQIAWTQTGKITSWARVPDPVIAFYLNEAGKAQGARNPEDIMRGHFDARDIAGKPDTLTGLMTYLYGIWPRQNPGERMLDWALRRFVYPGLFRAKRKGTRTLLRPEERDALILMAHMGDRQAMDHLIYFYEPLIIRCVNWALNKTCYSRYSFADLLSQGRGELMILILNYQPGQNVKPETYFISFLGWHIFHLITNEIPRRPMIAFDRPLENDAFGPEDYLPAPKLATEEDFALKEFLDQAIKGSGLNEKEQHVVMEYFFKDRTNEEIGEDFSQSRQNMQSILKGALKKLRQGPYAERLKDFL